MLFQARIKELEGDIAEAEATLRKRGRAAPKGPDFLPGGGRFSFQDQIKAMQTHLDALAKLTHAKPAPSAVVKPAVVTAAASALQSIIAPAAPKPKTADDIRLRLAASKDPREKFRLAGQLTALRRGHVPTPEPEAGAVDELRAQLAASKDPRERYRLASRLRELRHSR